MIGTRSSAVMKWMMEFFKQAILLPLASMVCGKALWGSDICPGLEPNENGWLLYQAGDWHCCGCPPGHKLVSDCRGPSELNSTCMKCGAGTYIVEKAHNIRSCPPIPGYVEPPTEKPTTTPVSTTTVAKDDPVTEGHISQSPESLTKGPDVWHGILIALTLSLSLALILALWKLQNLRKRRHHVPLSTEDPQVNQPQVPIGTSHHYNLKQRSSGTRWFDEQTETDGTNPDKEAKISKLKLQAHVHRSNSQVVAEYKSMSGSAANPLLPSPTSSQVPSNRNQATSSFQNFQSQATSSQVGDENKAKASGRVLKPIAISSWDTDEDPKIFLKCEEDEVYQKNAQRNEHEAMYEFFLYIENDKMIEVSDEQILKFAEQFHIKSSDFLSRGQGYKRVSLVDVYKKIYNMRGKKLQSEDIINHFRVTKQVLLAERLEGHLQSAQKLAPDAEQYVDSTKPFVS